MQDATPVIGILGPSGGAALRRAWSEWCVRHGYGVTIDLYPTFPCSCPSCTREECLLLRLSEMFLHDRRGYVLAPPLQEAVLPLLDELDDSARAAGRADTVWNDEGRLRGYALSTASISDDALLYERCNLWKIASFADER